MGRFPKIPPMAWAMVYALVMPLAVGFLVHPEARALLGTVNGSVAAAWTQAFGSVIAIAAAIWIDQGAARRARRHRLLEEVDRRAAVVSAVETVTDMVAEVLHQIAMVDGSSAALYPHRDRMAVMASRAANVAAHYTRQHHSRASVVLALQVAEEQARAVYGAVHSYNGSAVEWHSLLGVVRRAEAQLATCMKVANDELTAGQRALRDGHSASSRAL